MLRPMRYDIHEALRGLNYDERLTALIVSVVRSRPEALASAAYLIESASVMSIALSKREKALLVARTRDIADEIERDAMLAD